MGKGSSAVASAIPSPSRSSGKGGVASPAPQNPYASPASQNPYASQQASQSQYAAPLSGLGAIFGGYQQPSAQQAMDYSGESYIGGSPGFYDRFPEARGQPPEQYYPVPRTQPPPQYQQPNPYAAPFQQRYVQQFNPAPAQFVPQSAENYRSPFQQIVAPEPERRSGIGGKGGKGASPQPTRGERTYFSRPVETNPANKSQGGTVAPTTPMAQALNAVGSWDSWKRGGTVGPTAGRYLQGPGDGTSDSIPATIGNAQPARLADGEFVIDARTVSEIGNGSSNAGAKKLYAMMERVHRERKRAKRGQNSNADRFLPR